jgi:hypothetical protein
MDPLWSKCTSASVFNWHWSSANATDCPVPPFGNEEIEKCNLNKPILEPKESISISVLTDAQCGFLTLLFAVVKEQEALSALAVGKDSHNSLWFVAGLLCP